MIARLRGELLELDGSRAVVEASGVGYEVLVPASVSAHLPPVGQKVDLRIRQVFREDSVSLYGFLDATSVRMFDLLKEVKGCGPKVILSLIGEIGIDSLISGIVAQDSKMLSRASGVGPRLAERIIVELKEKVNQEALLNKIFAVQMDKKPLDPNSEDLVEALMSLGYRRFEIEQVARDTEGLPLETQIKQALKKLRA